jgi:hypothetical protein
VVRPLLPGLHGRFRARPDCPRASPERRSCAVNDQVSDSISVRSPQWSTGQPLQGALINKRRVQKRYREKVKRAQIDPSAAAGQDWDGMLAVIETILQATSAAN